MPATMEGSQSDAWPDVSSGELVAACERIEHEHSVATARHAQDAPIRDKCCSHQSSVGDDGRERGEEEGLDVHVGHVIEVDRGLAQEDSRRVSVASLSSSDDVLLLAMDAYEQRSTVCDDVSTAAASVATSVHITSMHTADATCTALHSQTDPEGVKRSTSSSCLASLQPAPCITFTARSEEARDAPVCAASINVDDGAYDSDGGEWEAALVTALQQEEEKLMLATSVQDTDTQLRPACPGTQQQPACPKTHQLPACPADVQAPCTLLREINHNIPPSSASPSSESTSSTPAVSEDVTIHSRKRKRPLPSYLTVDGSTRVAASSSTRRAPVRTLGTHQRRPVASAPTAPSARYTASLPAAEWNGDAIVCNTEVEASSACAELLAATPNGPFGFDIEWKVTFVKGEGQRPASLLQLANTGGRVVLFRLCCMPVFPPALHALLEDPGVAVVGVGIQGDVHKLHRDFGVSVRGAVDLAKMAERRMVSRAHSTLTFFISLSLSLSLCVLVSLKYLLLR